MDLFNNNNNGGNFVDSVDAILFSAVDFDRNSEDTPLYSSLVETRSSPPLFWDTSGHDNGDLYTQPGIDALSEEVTNGSNQTRATGIDTTAEEFLQLFFITGEGEYGFNNFETHQSQSLEDFLENNDFFEGPPRETSPAARFVLEALPEVELKGGNDRVCVICSEEVAEGKKAKLLPCWHYYHGECIMPWLKMRNTCPVCRFELPTNDEIEGYLRRKRRRIDTDNGSDEGSRKDFSVRDSFELSLTLDYED